MLLVYLQFFFGRCSSIPHNLQCTSLTFLDRTGKKEGEKIIRKEKQNSNKRLKTVSHSSLFFPGLIPMLISSVWFDFVLVNPNWQPFSCQTNNKRTLEFFKQHEVPPSYYIFSCPVSIFVSIVFILSMN